jgi:excisionase family DNA binding protein
MTTDVQEAPDPRQRNQVQQVRKARQLPVYLGIDDATEVMSVSAKTIRRRISDGTIPAHQRGRGTIRIRSEDLEGALESIPTFDW